jgi:peptidoglycan/LPS O-acetylase OafA/YrhL
MSGRFRELDGLRGIAALAVLASHFTGAYNSRYTSEPRPLFDFQYGAFGVQLFFLISGFVILMSADRAERPSDFIISRVSRIYPAYWISLILAIAVGIAFQVKDAQLTVWETIANFSMMQRWLQIPNAVDVYWTLAVELQFYVLIFALIVITRSRISDRVIFIVTIAWLSVSLCIALWAAPFSWGIDPQNVVTPVKIILNISLAEFGPLFCTGMLAYLSRRKGKPMLLMPVAGAVSVAVTILLHSWLHGAIVAGICGAFILIALRPSTPWLNLRGLQWFGKISYSLYIVHSTVGYLIIRWTWPLLGRDWAMLVALIGSALAAWAVYQIGEKRASAAMKRLLLNLRERTRSLRTADE